MSRVYDKTLIDDMVRHLSLPLPLAKQSAEEILAIIHEGLVRDGVVNVTNLGTFRLKPMAARVGFNPNTRERITIPAHQRIVFTPAKALRDQAEPAREASVPVESEDREAPTAPILRATEPLRPPIVVERVADISAVAPKHYPDSEPSRPPDAEMSPQPVNDAVVAAPGPVATALVEQERATVAIQASRQPATVDRSGVEQIRTISEAKAAHSSTRRRYFLGAAAILLLGLYLPFKLRETGPDALSAKAGVADAPRVLAAVAGGGDSFINQTNSPSNGAEPVSATTPAPGDYFKEQTFEIARGESLWLLAAKHYRDAYLWPHIYQANTTAIANPDYLVDGQIIVVPGLEGSPDALSEKDRHSIAKGYYLTYLFYEKTGRSDALLVLKVARRYDAKVAENYH